MILEILFAVMVVVFMVIPAVRVLLWLMRRIEK